MQRRNFLKQTLAVSAMMATANWPELSHISAANSIQSVGSSHGTYKKSMMWICVGGEGTVLEKCQNVKNAGFQGIEFSSHMDRKEVIDAMKSTGIIASSICNSMHGKYPMSSPDAAVRQQGVEAMITALEDAKAYGTDAVLLVPGFVSEEVAYDECWHRSVESIKKVIPTAEKLKVNICIENVWNNFMLSPMEAARYIDQFNSKFVGSYFDIGNVNSIGWAPQWIRILGKRIVRLHLKEFSRDKADKQGKWKGFDPALGEGDINWNKVMSEIRNINYNSWLTIEHHGGETPEGLKHLSSVWDDLVKR